MHVIEMQNSDLLFMYGAAVGMTLDHNGEVFYILQITAKDISGEIKEYNFAIPPMATRTFLKVANGMATKHEE